MTRNRVSHQISLPIRSEGSVGGNVDGDAPEAQEHGPPGVQSPFYQAQQQSHGASQHPMYLFGCERIVQAGHEFPPPMLPVMEFSASTPCHYEGATPDDLLTTFMSNEIETWGNLLDEYPSMVADEFDTNASPWTIPSSGFFSKTTSHFSQCG